MALGPDIKPIDYYGNTWADRWHESRMKSKYEDGRKGAGVDADTGETRR